MLGLWNGSAQGREERDLGLQLRPLASGPQGPASSPPCPGCPMTPSLAAGKEPAIPGPNATVLVFFLIITSLRDNYKFTFCSARSFIQSLHGRPGWKRRIDVCFHVAGVTG